MPMTHPQPIVHELKGPIGERLRALWTGNLKQLSWEEDFLAPFRRKDRTDGYVGLGKTLSGLLRVARHLGGEADDLRRRIVAELLITQEDDGYIGIYKPDARTYRVWDVHEQAYLIQALVENASFFGEDASLAAAQRLGRWLLPRLAGGRWREVGAGYVWNPLAVIGLDRAFIALGRTTGEAAFLDFCRDDLAVPDWFDPIVEGRQGEVRGHAYAYLARCLAQFSMSEGLALPDATRAVLGYLRAGGGLLVSGSCGHSECWHSDQRVDGRLGETCATAYLIRWAGYLLRLTNEAWYGDLMERAIYNALFAASSDDGRRIRYYSPAEGRREWHTTDTYCCPGNYRRIIAELPDLIARRSGDGLAIDLYEPCRIKAEIGGTSVELRIDTGYPFDGRVHIDMELEQATQFPLVLRRPGWAEGVEISCNGKPVAAQAGDGSLADQRPTDGWLTIERNWQNGDELSVRFATPWRLVRGFRRQLGRVAVMRGPVVWGADPSGNPGIGDRLAEVVPSIRSFRFSGQPRRATMSGELDGRNVDVALVPFSDLDTAVTYFTGRDGMSDKADHLLWLAPDPVGVGPAPGT